jgi:hypothetical protein
VTFNERNFTAQTIRYNGDFSSVNRVLARCNNITDIIHATCNIILNSLVFNLKVEILLIYSYIPPSPILLILLIRAFNFF